jgi:pyrroline-5-carboxylate reductase
VLNTYLEELKRISSADHVATKLMFQDFISSLSDSFSQDSNFESLINKIKSPGGTTQAGLESLQDNNLDKILQDAFQAAEDRSIEISNEQ